MDLKDFLTVQLNAYDFLEFLTGLSSTEYTQDAIAISHKIEAHFLTQSEIADEVKKYFDSKYNTNISYSKCIQLGCDVFNFLES